MFKPAILALALTVGGAAAATAQTNNFLGSLDLSPFETQTMSVAVATDKATGRKFNVVKLPNGKMMVLMSMDKISAFSPYADDSEMMYSGHTGTAR